MVNLSNDAAGIIRGLVSDSDLPESAGLRLGTDDETHALAMSPLTATTWVSPTVRKSSCSAGSSRLVSPSTRPGSRPRSSGGSGVAAALSPARNRPASRWRAEARPTITGGPRVDSRAAASSPRAACCNRPSLRTR